LYTCQIEAVAAEIHERHDAVRDIEAGLAGLQEVFSDMAVLAEGHGEMLDNIEAQVQTKQSALSWKGCSGAWQADYCWGGFQFVVVGAFRHLRNGSLMSKAAGKRASLQAC
jgi:Syntaxin